MAFKCGDCVTWQNSKNADRYGRKYCHFSKRYEEEEQSIYWMHGRKCPGFVWARRAVLTKICEILNINSTELFKAFDETRDNYVRPFNPELMSKYNNIALFISNGFDSLPNKEEVAKAMFNSYVIDAEANAKMGNYEKAVNIYSEMVKTLYIIFDVMNENTIFKKISMTR